MPCEISCLISRGDPASMPPGKSCRTRSGIHALWIVMPDLIRHPCVFTGEEWIPVSGTRMTGEGEYGFPCKTCEIDAQISRDDPASMPSGKSCRPVKSKHLFHGVIRHPSLKHYVKAWIFGSSPKMTKKAKDFSPLPFTAGRHRELPLQFPSLNSCLLPLFPHSSYSPLPLPPVSYTHLRAHET